MNDAERALIADLFQRIRGAATDNRDPEAEAFISEEVSRQPHAPYAMAQTVVVQNRALDAAKARIDQLERELAAARGQAQAEPAPRASSPWGPRAQASMSAADGRAARPEEAMSPPFGAPESRYGQQPGYGGQQSGGSPLGGQPRYEEPSRGGGFLSGALQTAAGVAGGALLFQGVRSLFGGEEGKAQQAGDQAGAGEAGSATQQVGDWYSGLFGGSDDKPGGADQRADGGQAAHAADLGGREGGQDDGDPDDGDFDDGGDNGGDNGGWA